MPFGYEQTFPFMGTEFYSPPVEQRRLSMSNFPFYPGRPGTFQAQVLPPQFFQRNDQDGFINNSQVPTVSQKKLGGLEAVPSRLPPPGLVKNTQWIINFEKLLIFFWKKEHQTNQMNVSASRTLCSPFQTAPSPVFFYSPQNAQRQMEATAIPQGPLDSFSKYLGRLDFDDEEEDTLV